MSQKNVVKTKLNGQSRSETRTTEVVPTAKRRQFNAAYKKRILAEVATCETGQIGAILRREGLYSSHLTDWRRQQKQAKKAKKVAVREHPLKSELKREVTQLRRENRSLKMRLEKAEAVVDIQKKVSLLIGLTLAESGPGESK